MVLSLALVAGLARAGEEDVGSFGPYDSVSVPVGSADGKFWGFVAWRADSAWMVLGQGPKLSPSYVGPFQEAQVPCFSDDGLLCVATARDERGAWLIFNGVLQGPLGGAWDASVCRDGSSWGYTVRRTDGVYVVIHASGGTEEYGPFLDAAGPVFSGDGRAWAFVETRASKQGSDRFAVLLRLEGDALARYDFGGYDRISRLCLSDDGARFAFAFSVSDRWQVYDEGSFTGFFREVSDLAHGPGTALAMGVMGAERWSVRNGQKDVAGPYNEVGDVAFGPDSSIAWVARMGEPWWVFISKEGSFLQFGPYYAASAPRFTENGWVFFAFRDEGSGSFTLQRVISD